MLILNGVSDITSDFSILTPTGHPIVQSFSDTNAEQLASDSRGLTGSVPQDYPHFRHQSQVLGPQATNIFVQFYCKFRYSQDPTVRFDHLNGSQNL